MTNEINTIEQIQEKADKVSIALKEDYEYYTDKYIEVDEALVRKNIFSGNKILTLDYGYRYDGIIKSFKEEDGEEYVFIDFGEKEIAKRNFENVSNEKMRISDLAYWICEVNEYCDINATFVPPF